MTLLKNNLKKKFEEEFEEKEKDVSCYIDLMWNNMHNYWRKLKEVPYGREKLVSYGLAINAHIDSLEILDIYYPYKALDNDSKDKAHGKASYCKMVVDKLHKLTNLKHLKFEVDQECSSVDVEEIGLYH